MKSIFVCASALLAFGTIFSAGATAGEHRVLVSYANLDLTKSAGKQTLMAELKLAAHRICGAEPTVASRLNNGAIYEKCIKETMGRAMASLPAAVIAKLNAGQPFDEASLR